MNSAELISGNPYSLESLFSGDKRKIIIPDLQRDYCWAEEKKDGVSLVQGFIDNLIDYFDNRKENEEMNLGLIYAYENPPNFVHLCDGQQRLTTLYLLIGLLYRRTKNELLKKCLISADELNNDDHEGYLQYAIRDTSLFFLNELVFHYFIERENAHLERFGETYYSFNTSGFFARYKNDKTVNNICTAIHQIDQKLDQYFSLDINRKLDSFIGFVLTQIKLLYYKVNSRQQGEDMFVVINTTGLELTTTENLKPALLGDLNDEVTKNYQDDEEIVKEKIGLFNEAWERREDFFWENKEETEQIADEGLKAFFSWILKIELLSDGLSGRLEPTIKEFRKWKTKENLTSEELLKKVEAYYRSLQKTIHILNQDTSKVVFNSIIANERKYTLKDITLSSLRNLTYDTTQTGSVTQQQYFLLPLLALVTKFKDTVSDLNIAAWIRFLRYNYFSKKRYPKEFNPKDLLEIIAKSDSSQECFNLLFTEEFKFTEELRIIDTETIDEWCNDWDFMGNLSPLFEAALSHVEDKTANIDLLLEFKVYINLYRQLQDITYNFQDINKELIPLANLLTFDFYANANHRSGKSQYHQYYSIDIERNNKNFILSDKEYFKVIWNQLRVNGIIKAQEELVKELAPKLETLWTGQFWLLLLCAEASNSGQSIGNYIGIKDKTAGLSYFNNNPFDYWNGGKVYNLNKLEGNWQLYNSVGNTYVGFTKYNKKSAGFDYIQGSLVEELKRNEELFDIEFQIKERETYFFSVIEEVYNISLKQRFKFSDKQRKNEIRFQLFNRIKEQVKPTAKVCFYEGKSIGIDPWNDYETDGYSELDWFTVGIPFEEKYLIAVTSNREMIQVGLRKHPITKPEEQEEIAKQLKKIIPGPFKNLDPISNGWWYLYKAFSFNEKYNDADFFVEYLLGLYNELNVNANMKGL